MNRYDLSEAIKKNHQELIAKHAKAIAEKDKIIAEKDRIESGMTGTLVPASSPDSLARAIVDYAADRATARRHAKAARRVAEPRLSIDRMVSDYASMYRLALTEAGVAVPRDGIAVPAAAR